MLRMRAGGGGWDGDGMEWNGSRAVLAPCLLYALPCPACLLPGNRRRARGGGTPHTFTYYYYSLEW